MKNVKNMHGVGDRMPIYFQSLKDSLAPLWFILDRYTPKIAKIPRFSHFGYIKNSTSDARIKILRPLFNKN